jgi:hypothetical protein
MFFWADPEAAAISHCSAVCDGAEAHCLSRSVVYPRTSANGRNHW